MELNSGNQWKKHELLVRQLSDGEFHSGESLGELLGVSRAAVWKHVKSLEDLGVDFESVRGQGYRIPGGLILLDEDKIKEALSSSAKSFYECFHIFNEIDSTNRYLLTVSETESVAGVQVCLAERQSAGRGRRGRVWVSPFGKNIYCSLLWRFNKSMSALDGLSLVVALAIYKVLSSKGAGEIQLKWPNDILSDSSKLAGILLEIRGDLSEFCDVVIGFGINLQMSSRSGQEINQAWTDLSQLGIENLDRNVLLAEILDQLAEDLNTFESHGFGPFVESWNAADAFVNREVNLLVGKDQVRGESKGVDENGALLLEIDGVIKAFHGGEISLRAVEE